MKGVGLAALFSIQGDWAFDYALNLARRHKAKLNIFQFLESPYLLRRDVVFVDAEKTKTASVTPELIAEKDKDLRFKFDDRLGDYTDVGFRVCEGADEWELRKCFKRGEYDVLVIGYQGKGADFGGTTTIEKFAAGFHGPLVLVGPDGPTQFFLNDKAKGMVADLGIDDGQWELIKAA